MTERLYYDQPYLITFQAHVTSVRGEEGACLVALDRSAFYPTSGGQPYDTGTLNGCRVTDVLVDKEGEVWHAVEGEFSPGDAVQGRIDWERRFDHMQQHAGEHMLAGAVWELYGGTTIGLHLGKAESTIDVEFPDGRTRLKPEEIRTLETLVNQRITADVPIRAWFPEEKELSLLALRKPPTVKKHIRVVGIGDFEMVACGGTHPSSTGQIGLIHLISVTPSRGKARFTFACGKRAMDLFRNISEKTEEAGALLSADADHLADAVRALQAKNAALEKELFLLRKKEVADAIVEAEAETGGDFTLAALTLREGDMAAANAAISDYIRIGKKVVLLSVGERLIFARGPEAALDMGALIREVGRGGGRPELASGTGGPEAVRKAEKILKN